MSHSTHQLAMKGVDQTASAFASIQARAALTGAQIRKVVGGAISAASAYLSVRAVGSAIQELGELSDIAQKTSTSVDELTRATTAMGVLGINMDVNSLAKAFQMMEKNTGRSGLQGFYDTIGELGKIPDTADRAAAAMQVFGRSGMEFMPLINAADETTNALEDVIKAMPGISQAAADAGDDAADAMAIAAAGVKSIWQTGIGTIVGWFSKNYTGGIRQAAAEGANTLVYYAKTSVAVAIAAFQRLVQFWKAYTAWYSAVGDFIGAKIGGMSFAESWDYAAQNLGLDLEEINIEMERIDDQLSERTSRFTMEWEDRKAAVERFYKAYDRAAKSSKARELRDFGAMQAAKATALRNELIMGGSAAALKLAVNGPQYRDEVKKQTTILERIAKNTEKTAENTKESGESYAATDL